MHLLSSATNFALRRAGALKSASMGVLVLTMCSCAANRPCDLYSDNNPDIAGPPHPCRVDGCSLAPDLDIRDCCDIHDSHYWSGGSAELRKRTDQEFRSCIIDAGHPVTAGIYYYVVRVGGTPYLPTNWRWGFGWDYPRGYTDPL